PREELVAHGSEKSFDLPLGRAVPYGRVGKQAADAGADLDDFLGGVDGAVIDVEAGGHPAFVEGGAQGLNQGSDILSREKLAVTADPAGVIEEGNETGLDGDAPDLEVRAVERVGLPHLIGVGFGEGQAVFARAVAVGLEHFVLADQAVEGGAGHLGTVQKPLLDAQAVEDRTLWSVAMDFGPDRLDDFQNVLGFDLAGLALVGPRLVLHDGNAVFAVAAQPGGDGAPGELARV